MAFTELGRSQAFTKARSRRRAATTPNSSIAVQRLVLHRSVTPTGVAKLPEVGCVKTPGTQPPPLPLEPPACLQQHPHPLFIQQQNCEVGVRTREVAMKNSGANHFSKDRWSLVRLIDAAIYTARAEGRPQICPQHPPPLASASHDAGQDPLPLKWRSPLPPTPQQTRILRLGPVRFNKLCMETDR